MSFQFAMGQRVFVPGSQVQGIIAGRAEFRSDKAEGGVGREYVVASLNPDMSLDQVQVEESVLVKAQPPEMVTLASSEKAIADAREEGVRSALAALVDRLVADGTIKRGQKVKG